MSRALIIGPSKMRSAAREAAWTRNAQLGTAAVQARIAARTPWKCQNCGTERPATYNWNVRKYCSMACKTAHYGKRFQGAANPNWQGVSEPRICPTCLKYFSGESHARKYCSRSCKARSPASMAHMRKLARIGGAAAAEAYKKKPRPMPRRFCKKDDNHDAIVLALTELGCSVRDTSAVGGGFPDLIVGLIGRDHLIEVKNRNTKYGRKGLADTQREFAAAWRGASVVVLHDRDEATAWVQSQRQRLLGGNW